MRKYHACRAVEPSTAAHKMFFCLIGECPMPYRKIPSVLQKNIVRFTEEFHPFYLRIPSVLRKNIICFMKKSHTYGRKRFSVLLKNLILFTAGLLWFYDSGTLVLRKSLSGLPKEPLRACQRASFAVSKRLFRRLKKPLPQARKGSSANPVFSNCLTVIPVR